MVFSGELTAAELTEKVGASDTTLAPMWCTRAIHIRTGSLAVNSSGYVVKSDRSCTFFVVEVNEHLIIVQEDRIHKGIDQHLPMLFLVHIQLTEPEQPESKLLSVEPWLHQLLAGDLLFKFVTHGLQLFQTALGGLGKDALLDGIEKVGNAHISLFELLFI